MKHIRATVFFILFCFASVLSWAQVPTQHAFNGTFNIITYQTSGSVGDFEVTGFFNDYKNDYTEAGISANMILWDNLGNRFVIDSVSHGSTTILFVTDLNSYGMVETGMGAIIDEANGCAFFVAGVSDQLNNRIGEHTAQICGGGGSGVIDSTRLVSDSILVYYQSGAEIGRDTVRLAGTGGLGDNWGSQVVQSDATLSGDGTSGNPLTIAQQGATSGQVLKWNGTTWLPQNDDFEANTDNQTLSNSVTGTSNTISISNGNSIVVDVADNDNSSTNELQTLSTDGTAGNVSISNGNTVSINVNDADASSTNEIQDISTDGTAGNISISLGSTIVLNVDDADADPTNENQTVSAGFGVNVTQVSQDFNVSVDTLLIATPYDVSTAKIDSSYVRNDSVFVREHGVEFYTGRATTGSGGDNWGTQVVQSDATLSGTGIVGDELGIAQQGATSGQVLKWNGTTWLPASDEVNDADADPNNEIQTLSVTSSGENRDLTISGGNTVTINVADNDNSSTNEFQAMTGGYGINVTASGNDYSFEADTTQLATQYDLTQNTYKSPPGAILFSGSDSTVTSKVDSFYFNEATGMLGLGTISPTAYIDVVRGNTGVDNNYVNVLRIRKKGSNSNVYLSLQQFNDNTRIYGVGNMHFYSTGGLFFDGEKYLFNTGKSFQTYNQRSIFRFSEFSWSPGGPRFPQIIYSYDNYKYINGSGNGVPNTPGGTGVLSSPFIISLPSYESNTTYGNRVFTAGVDIGQDLFPVNSSIYALVSIFNHPLYKSTDWNGNNVNMQNYQVGYWYEPKELNPTATHFAIWTRSGSIKFENSDSLIVDGKTFFTSYGVGNNSISKNDSLQIAVFDQTGLIREIRVDSLLTGVGDNLGNHTATQDLNMGDQHDLINLDSLTWNQPGGPNANSVYQYVENIGGKPEWVVNQNFYVGRELRVGQFITFNDAYSFPDTIGTNNQVLVSNGVDNLLWQDVPGDNLGNHIATQDLDMASFYINNIGAAEFNDWNSDGKKWNIYEKGVNFGNYAAGSLWFQLTGSTSPLMVLEPDGTLNLQNTPATNNSNNNVLVYNTTTNAFEINTSIAGGGSSGPTYNGPNNPGPVSATTTYTEVWRDTIPANTFTGNGKQWYSAKLLCKANNTSGNEFLYGEIDIINNSITYNIPNDGYFDTMVAGDTHVGDVNITITTDPDNSNNLIVSCNQLFSSYTGAFGANTAISNTSGEIIVVYKIKWSNADGDTFDVISDWSVIRQ